MGIHYTMLAIQAKENKGTPKMNVFFFRTLPESGGGEAPARILWPFFYHVLVSKIGNFVPKTLYICMFFGHVCHHYHQNYHHNYHCNRHYHHRHFFCHTRKTSFLTSEKEDQVARIGGGGGRGNCPKENILFLMSCSLSRPKWDTFLSPFPEMQEEDLFFFTLIIPGFTVTYS